MKITVKDKPILKCTFIIIVILVTGSSLFSQPERQLIIGQQPVYKAAKARESMTIYGKMDEASWKNAEVVSFNYFYRADKPVEKQNTKFRMLWDVTNI